MLYQITFRAMGTDMLAAMDCDEPSVAMLNQVPIWFENWENSFSRFRLDSELSQLNRSNGLPFKVSEDLWSVLLLAQEVENKTDGLITPCVLGALEGAGYLHSFDWMRTQNVIETGSFGQPASMAEIQWDYDRRIITLPKGLRLDLGGVAKGWAAHQVTAKLKPIAPALMDAGGDISVNGSMQDGSNWPVSFQNPVRSNAQEIWLGLGEFSAATSGSDRRRWQTTDGWMHHIIDPRTGKPAVSDAVTATVLASDVMLAEMAAKKIVILGSEIGLDWLENQIGFAGFVITSTGETIKTNRFLELEMSEAWQN